MISKDSSILNSRNDAATSNLSFQSAVAMPNTARGNDNESDYKVLHETSLDHKDNEKYDKGENMSNGSQSFYEN
jgi:hypothetical protein